MESIEAEICETGQRSDTRGRRIYSAGERERLLREYDQSGLTQAAFAKREGLRYTTFVGWLQRRRRQVDGKASHGGRPATFQEIALPGSLERKAPLEVRFADGTLVRGECAGEVAALVRAIRG